jgi:RNA polymerase sigma factor (sigma-70 family)
VAGRGLSGSLHISNPSEPAESSLTALIRHWPEAEEAVVEKLYREHFPRLQALARRSLAHLPGSGTEAEDAVQSAIKSLVRYFREPSHHLNKDSSDFWKLLITLVVRKARRRVTRQTRGLTGGNLRPAVDLTAADGTTPLDSLPDDLAPAEFDRELAELLEPLSGSLRTVALLLLEDCSHVEIAARMDCSTKTVQRKVKLLADALERHLAEEA